MMWFSLHLFLLTVIVVIVITMIITPDFVNSTPYPENSTPRCILILPLIVLVIVHVHMVDSPFLDFIYLGRA